MALYPLLLCLYFCGCQGSLTVYPSPSGIPHSTKFSVNVGTSPADKRASFTYMLTSDNRASEIGERTIRSGRTVSWTSFAFSGEPVTVEITTLTDFRECLVRPKRYGFSCQRTAANTAEVVITNNTRMMSVEFDYDYGTSGHSDIRNKLMIFADAPEQDVPAGRHSSLLYYGPHVYNLHGQMVIGRHIREIYIAPGAYIHGGFKTSAHPGLRIHGRGIISGELYAHRDNRIEWATIFHQAGHHHEIDGIILVDPARFYIKAPGNYNTVRNVKTVAPWAFNTDGVVLGRNGIVEDSFFMANDDAVKIYYDHLTVSRCVIWQSHNGAVFQFGWSRRRVAHHARISDIDVIHTDWCAFKENNCNLNQNAAILDIAYNERDQAPRHIHISDIEIRNVRIEGTCPRLFYFNLASWVTGFVSNVRLINWSVERLSTNAFGSNEISGSQAIPVSNWNIVNLKINNICVRNPRQVPINSDGNASLRFVCRRQNEDRSERGNAA